MSGDHVSDSKLALLGIGLVVVAYIVAAFLGLPQRGTELRNSGHHAKPTQEEHSDDKHEQSPTNDAQHPAEEKADHGSDNHAEIIPPSIGWVIPFALLLLCIAILPLISFTAQWWESNLSRFIVAAVLGLVVLGYYFFLHDSAVEAHWPTHSVVQPAAEGPSLNVAATVFANAFLEEYIPFIVLLFSLYTISGGIRIQGDLAAHPVTNTTFIAVGGLLASFIGTTGAAMLLIRPLLETNVERKHVRHTVVFFIFVVCNCGGLLLPIGDPPLFLGYLRGVDFFWTLNLWQEWLVVNLLLLAIYWTWDHFFAYPKETISSIERDETQLRPLQFKGLLLNAPLLVGVILAVAFLDPLKAIPGTDWHPWMYLREIVQISLVGISLAVGSRQLRADNRFNYHAILEVAALFCGIFLCMQPALQILNEKGDELGLNTPMEFFWATGTLSAVLDNAPTYVVFFETAKQMPADQIENYDPMKLPTGTIHIPFLVGISLGAVFMGAMTYIGNGPNFMVKAIAEKSGVAMPSFFGYMLYSVTILLPVLVVASMLFMWVIP